MGTAALTYHDGRVYVPTSGLSEESADNGRSAYVCCSYRGTVTALDANTGKQLWVLDTNKEFPTVNGVKATGGSMDGAGPIIVDGLLCVVSGNGGPFGSAGNVVLAFAVE